MESKKTAASQTIFCTFCQQVQLAFDDMATIKGLLVLPFISRGVNAWGDNASSPSIDAIYVTIIISKLLLCS